MTSKGKPEMDPTSMPGIREQVIKCTPKTLRTNEPFDFQRLKESQIHCRQVTAREGQPEKDLQVT